MAGGTETCPRCNGSIGLDQKGMIGAHYQLTRQVGRRSRYEPCLGSGQPPLVRLEPTDAARRILCRITTDPNRATKQACDLLLELIRQDARNDPDALVGMSVKDFQQVVAEVATDLVQERAFR